MKKNKIIIVVIISIITLILSFGVEIDSVRIGKFNDFKNTNNKDIKNSEFFKFYNSDKLLVINLWATWCKPCIEEVPDLNALKMKHKNNKHLLFLSLSLDNDSIKLKKYIESNSFKFKDITFNNIYYRDTILALIENKKMSFIKSQSIPKTILIKDKKIIKIFEGTLDEKEYKKIDSIVLRYE